MAVLEVPGTAPQHKALEAAATTLYRISSGRSPAASFGRTPADYQISSGNNARLAAAGRRYRGGPDLAAPAGPASVPVNGLPGADPARGLDELDMEPMGGPRQQRKPRHHGHQQPVSQRDAHERRSWRRRSPRSKPVAQLSTSTGIPPDSAQAEATCSALGPRDSLNHGL